MENLKTIISEELNKYQNDIETIKLDKKIDCITIFASTM